MKSIRTKVVPRGHHLALTRFKQAPLVGCKGLYEPNTGCVLTAT
ncbi:hypothetical protein [Spirosoma endophyticum]|nr:hypothetical protein [Spirosoma endophyticum]